MQKNKKEKEQKKFSKKYVQISVFMVKYSCIPNLTLNF